MYTITIRKNFKTYTSKVKFATKEQAEYFVASAKMVDTCKGKKLKYNIVKC